MNDYGTRHTDLAVKRAEWRLSRVYRQAQRDIDEKLKEWQKGHAARETAYRQQLKDGKITQADFDAWMRGQVFQEKQWQQRKAQIDEILLNADREAQRIVNEGKLGVFVDNANYMGYKLEHDAHINTGFTLYDQNTVARLIKRDPQILPKPAPGVQKDKAYTYYNKLMNVAITQGIVEGETIPQIAKRIVNTTGERSYSSAVRNARTAYTGAQNAGRIEGLHQAQELGIKVQKQWSAILDDRTRDAHADLDGQVQDIDAPFITQDGQEIMYPGDPTADPSLVYNCRCRLVYVYPDYPSDMERRDNETGEIIGDMTYAEWEEMKQGETQTEEPAEQEQQPEEIPDISGMEIRYIPAEDIYETPKETLHRNLTAIGYSESEIDELSRILDRHTAGHEVQAEADAEIMEHLQANDRIGQLIRDKSELERQAWELHIEEERKKAYERYEQAVEDAKRDLQPGGIYANYTEEDLRDWGVWPEKPNIREPMLYRKGDLDRDVLAFSTLEGGAVMGFLDDGGIGYDITMSLDELEEQGYMPIAGVISFDVGAAGEGEVLFVRMPENRHRRRRNE